MIHCNMQTNRIADGLLVISVQAVDQNRKDPRLDQVVYGRVTVTGQQLPAEAEETGEHLSYSHNFTDTFQQNKKIHLQSQSPSVWRNIRLSLKASQKCLNKAAGKPSQKTWIKEFVERENASWIHLNQQGLHCWAAMPLTMSINQTVHPYCISLLSNQAGKTLRPWNCNSEIYFVRGHQF